MHFVFVAFDWIYLRLPRSSFVYAQWNSGGFFHVLLVWLWQCSLLKLIINVHPRLPVLLLYWASIQAVLYCIVSLLSNNTILYCIVLYCTGHTWLKPNNYVPPQFTLVYVCFNSWHRYEYCGMRRDSTHSVFTQWQCITNVERYRCHHQSCGRFLEVFLDLTSIETITRVAWLCHWWQSFDFLPYLKSTHRSKG